MHLSFQNRDGRQEFFIPGLRTQNPEKKGDKSVRRGVIVPTCKDLQKILTLVLPVPG